MPATKSDNVFHHYPKGGIQSHFAGGWIVGKSYYRLFLEIMGNGKGDKKMMFGPCFGFVDDEILPFHYIR